MRWLCREKLFVRSFNRLQLSAYVVDVAVFCCVDVEARARNRQPLFVARRRVEQAANEANEAAACETEAAACEQAARGLLACSAASRSHPAASAAAAAFFVLPARFAMPQPRQGAVSSRQLVAHVTQRKFSMLFSAISQRSFADHASEPLVY